MVEASHDFSAHRRARGRHACPGLFRITPAADGGLCRVKLALGRVSAEAAGAIAAAALRFGSGIIETTNRANLQLRGIAAEREEALIDALLAAGLGPRLSAADDIRNVMVSPTAGIDARAALDVRPLAEALLERLESEPACHALSPKISFLIDGGEALAAIDHAHDIWLAYMPGAGVMALGFAGSPPLAEDASAPFVAVEYESVLPAVIAATALFQEEAAGDPTITRMRHLLARTRVADFLGRLAARLGPMLRRDDALRAWRRAKPSTLGDVGVERQPQEGLAYVGAKPPLARMSPETLAGLASVADGAGSGELRLTPWHGVIVPNVPLNRAQEVVRALAGLGLVTDRSDPLATLVACAGSSGCAASFVDAKADALRIARALASRDRAPPSLHVSGCAKSCASARVADLTLVGTAPGRYELFRKSPGASGFGSSLARDLDASAAGERIAAIAAARGPRAAERA